MFWNLLDRRCRVKCDGAGDRIWGFWSLWTLKREIKKMNISLCWFSWSLWTGSWFWAVFAVVLWQIVVAALCWTARTRLGQAGPGRAWTRAEQICFRCHFTERETWYNFVVVLAVLTVSLLSADPVWYDPVLSYSFPNRTIRITNLC